MNEKKGNLWKRGKRLLAALLALALVIAYFPAGTLTAQAETAAAQTDGETTPADGTAAGQTDDETQTPPAEDENDGTVPAEETGNVPAVDAGTTPVNEEPGTAPAGNGGTTSAGTSGTTPVDNSSSVPAAGGAGMTSGAGNEITPEEDGIATLEETGGNILETDGGEIEWNFKESSAPIYTEHKDGSLSASDSVSYNSGGHGMMLVSGSELSIDIPAGQTTLKLGICEYSNETLTATVSTQEEVIRSELSFKGSDDAQELSIEYSTNIATTLTIQMSGSGQAYLHYIKAETIDPGKIAAVSGQVTVTPFTDSVVGETLVFTDSSTGETTETVIDENGSYMVSLSVERSYTVAFGKADIYEITSEDTFNLSAEQGGTSVTQNISCRIIWDMSKSFSFEINGTTFTVKPGASSSEDLTADGNGSVELATTDTAIIWANLGGAGTGTLTEDMLENVTDSVGYSLSENTITFTYKDSSMAPTEYTIQVKDNSASGNPHQDGTTHTYDFRDGSVVSTLHDTNYRIQNNNSVHSTDKLLTLYGESLYFHDPQHGIAFASGTQFQIKTAGNAEIVFGLCNSTAQNSVLTAEVSGTGTIEATETSAVGAEDGSEAVFKYTGDAATITFTYTGTGTGYLHSISVTNALPVATIIPQEEMPEILDYGTQGSITESVIGQRLILSQEDGSLGTGSALSGNVSYYGFELTSDRNKLEADVTVNSCGNSSSNGVFFGVFDGTAIETVGIRNSTNLRGIYTREDNTVGAGRINETITEGQTVHFTAERTANGFVITVTPDGGETYTMTSSNSDVLVSGNGEVSFGFILANASVTVTNMKYYDANEDLLYDQNDCYQAIGTAPQASNVRAVPVSTRDAINVMWNTTDLPYGDAHYVIQVSTDNGGSWETVGESQTTSFLYQTTESGIYMFRVGGAVGNAGEVQGSYAVSGAIDFLAALLTPTLTAAAAADASSIQLTWTPVEEAVSYELYRYSSDQGAENAAVLATVSGISYTDTNVELEVPYYYYVIAKSADNSSNPSETVWTMVSAGHTGDYAHEDEAAVITITDCPSATVFQNAITISGTVDRAGAMKAYVNDASLTAAAAEQQVAAGGSFTLNLQLKEGRNDVRLIFTDENGTETCLTYNFVYLSNSDIDMIVDASYTGEGGTEIDGIPTYKTVQAAVNAAAENVGVQRTAEKTVIFIKNGDYKERLVVNTPNISLIGESEDGVRIHCYPAELYPNDPGYEAGGDMKKRCATYITSNATGFSAENLTFANDYDYSTPDGKSNKSADALRCDADGASFVNVTFSGVQDTLYMHEGNQYFYKCRIEGLIDFIYSGDEAKALFEECELVFVYEGTHPEGGYICAPRTAADSEYGLIFYNCSVTSEEGCEDGTFHLARPWGPNAAIYWINCYLGSAINADEPYDDMSGNTFMDANFYEYGSYGPGYAVNADRKQISPAAAKALLTAAVDALGADDGNILTDIKAGKLDPQQPQAKPPVDDPSDIPGGGNEGNTGNGGDSGNGGNTGNGSQTGGGNGGSSGSSGSGSGSVAQTTTAQGAATGDSTDIFTWVAVLVVAGAAAATITVRSRKKNQ